MAGPQRTHHVALVRDDAVLLAADGSLPRFVQDLEDDDGPDPTAYATTLAGPGVHLAPVVTLPPEDSDDRPDRLHVLALRGAAPAGAVWRRADDLPEPWRSPVRLALEQYAGVAPPRRPDWFRPGWHDRVEAWVDRQLSATGRRRTGPLRTHRVWSISAVLEVPTDRGALWFKACCDHFVAEAAIVHRLARRIGELVPGLVATDDEAGWLLMEPLRGAADSDRAEGAVDAAAPAWARAQVAALDWLDELRAAGCPERGLEATLEGWRAVLATSPELARLTDAERQELPAATARAEALVRELSACGIPDTLSHGDLHPGNVAYDGSEVRIFDWTDGCVSHPFLDGSHLARVLDWYGTGEGEAERVLQAYAGPWRDAFPDADVDRALELAPLADLVFQSVTFAQIAAAAEDGVGDFEGVVLRFTREVIARVR
ncbi:aminoglycoside phosphotransferase family protein [Nocardioides flavus (ex Wang et al. 2016)]|nr:phosphotransferase [Nocardioides flavus (ex Wang et al. 2016)]